jgi:N-acetylmuramoyl-L-alanine amidase
VPFAATSTVCTNTSRILKIPFALLLALTILSAAPTPEEKHLSIYSPVAIYTLPVTERNGRDYIGLLELLEPLGRVTSIAKGRSLTLRFNEIDSIFTAGNARARIQGRDLDLAAPFLIENSRGLIPLNSLPNLVPRFLGGTVDFHAPSRRLFIGSTAVQPSFRLDTTTPAHLLVEFGAPVNPTVSTQPGSLKMIFKRDPVVSPGSQSITFDNPVITHAAYAENDGEAEIDISANQPLMASFSTDRKTITISANPPVASPPTATAPQNPPPQPANPEPAPPRILVVVDPAHGGEERGAALTDKVVEKDVTLGFARLLRHELQVKGFAVNLLRDSDLTLSLDQRASTANVGHPALYIALHAVSQGIGARIYTSLLPVETESKGVFHAWNHTQSTFLPTSQIFAATIATALEKSQFPSQVSSASLRPLNNISEPAVAVELAPGANGIADLISANYQQRAAAAIADAVFSIRDRLSQAKQ